MKIHIVQKGDTLWDIALKYNVDFDSLIQLNSHIATPDMIMPGMKIKIPDTLKEMKPISPSPQPIKKQESKKEEHYTHDIDYKKKEQPKMPELPKMPVEEPLSLPILEMEKDAYPTTPLPEFKEKTEYKKDQVKPTIEPPKPDPKVEHSPSYKKTPEHPQYSPHPKTMEGYYPFVQPTYPVMTGHMGCSSCGQPILSGYPPYGMPVPMPMPVPQTMPYQQQSYGTSMMYGDHQMQQHYAEQDPSQPYQPATYPAYPDRKEEEVTPKPPGQYEEEKDTDLNTNE